METFSLFFPPDKNPDTAADLHPAAWRDLGMDAILAAFTPNRDHRKDLRPVLAGLIRDPDIIRYRQDILADLLDHPTLVERLAALLPVIDSLAGFEFHSMQALNSLYEVSWRLGELQNIIDCIEGLGSILAGDGQPLQSQGFRTLRDQVLQFRQDPTYQNLRRELPDLLEAMRAIASITIGVNLDASLRPVQATLLSVNATPFSDQSLLNRLFGKGEAGIAPLHSVPQRMVEGQVALPINPELGWAVEPMMVPLFADLAKVLEKTTAPVAKRLKRYSELHSGLLTNLRRGLIFYLGAVGLARRLQALGLPVCRPEIAPLDERVCAVRQAYNLHLALRASPPGAAIVTNDVRIDDAGRILILTGPNQGGKTTYVQGIGVLHVLAQAGCWIPGAQARISPVDNIFTHFPLEEKPETDAGRFGEEAMRLGDIFAQITRHSLALLNESLSSTSFGESLYLAQDLVRILRRIGARALFSTHLHELAERAAELNASVAGDSPIISVVSSPVTTEPDAARGEATRSYRIEFRPPLGQSYAREIAARYGISYAQLEQGLTERGVLS